MNKVKIGLRGLNAASLLEKAESILQAEAWKAEFSESTPVFKKLREDRSNLNEAIELAAFGDKRAIAIRKKCEDELKNTIRALAAFVDFQSGGDENVICRAGFEVKNNNNRPKPLQPPVVPTLKRTNNEGELIISWTPVINSRNYIVQCNHKNPENDKKWITVCYSTKSRCVISELEPGKIYWIRIKAVGAKGISPPSQPAQIMAA